ncbi:MAG: tRNA 2-thiouridine(34) synthase MnmA [Desulfobacteraceae bacterium]|nr:tRNA 2-thiouridine(34) synthase MnmA [Desulfobacteraceae bacterium]MBC2757096.1 tRNA 2-thiouridine(34) synthase MnmA [Desulfobacteraceae bacterium]MBC2763688.1 tRNA 2-thiouridine(34) synthase MnmA [ANME-2 cluster archaeon]
MKPKIAVAISGGVDSLVAAFILKKKYENIVGLHFLNGYEPAPFQPSESPSESFERSDQSIISIYEPPDAHPITHIANQLNIPIKLVDCRYHFQKYVVDYFVQSYRKGLTPNPCIICNPLIKFGIVFDLAKHLGASYFATGHYAGIIEKADDQYFLTKGRDSQKDQSYFLAFLSRKVLPFIRFPLGNMTKQQVIEMAVLNGLTPVLTKESQDVCFIHNNDYAYFLTSQDRFVASPGLITDSDGRRIGAHQGLHKFTIGQRRGINCPASEPYYVLKIDMEQNRLIVGFKKDLYKTGLKIKNINWFIPKPKSNLDIFVKIRYRHQATEAVLIPQNEDSAKIYFKKPQPAVTPGQGAVCYIGDEVIAGGWIHE